MTRPRPSALALAIEVVAAEARADRDGVEVAVPTKLRATLGKLIGTHGFNVVLTRALTLAKREEPSLFGAVLDPDGMLKGLASTSADRERGLTKVLAHLIELLMRFIGEELTARVVRDTWPDVNSVGGSETTR